MDGLKLWLTEEHAVFNAVKGEDAVFSLSHEELCVFSLVQNSHVSNKEFYEQLYCSDGALFTSDGKPIYVLKWNLGTN